MKASELLKTLRGRLTVAVSSARHEIGELREAIANKRRELNFAKHASLPLAEIQDRIAEAVHRAGAAWLTQNGPVLMRGEHGLGVYKPRFGRGRLPFTQTEGIPFGALCAGSPETAIAFLSSLYAAVPYRAGPPSAERPALINRLTRELAELEQAEEEMIDAAAANGVAIEHRPEVKQRRYNEQRAREREEQEIADRAARQAAVDEGYRRKTWVEVEDPNHQGRLRGRFVTRDHADQV